MVQIRFYCLGSRGPGAALMAAAAVGGHREALYSLAVIQFNGSGGGKDDRDLRAGAALLATPEAGAFEVDANARPYFTAADGIRRSIMLADTAAPTVKVLPDAGSGATATITATGTAGIVQLVTSAATRAGDLFTVTYAHAYPSASYPVIAAANAAAVALVRNGYLTATASGFTVSQPATSGTTLPAGTYAITFNAPGA